MLSVKQGGIKYHFLSLWYDSTWDWTQVSRAIGDHLFFVLYVCVFLDIYYVNFRNAYYKIIPWFSFASLGKNYSNNFNHLIKFI